jgi:hypothetical protein
MDSDNNKAQAYAAYKAFTTLMGNPAKKQLIKLCYTILNLIQTFFCMLMVDCLPTY